jgi:hypothetical protein
MNIQPGSSKVRFGEVYELRFQREGTCRPLRKHPDTLNHHVFNRKSQTPAESLAAYFEQNKLAAQVYIDDIDQQCKLNNAEARKRANLKKHSFVVTDGPTEKTVSKMAQIQAEREDTLARLRWYVQENLFPIKMPVVTIRYALRKATEADCDRLGGDAGKDKLMEWTNQAEVLTQIHAAQIDKQA